LICFKHIFRKGIISDHAGKEFYMRKRNLILLSLICILSLCVFTGLLVYAFDLQAKRDLKDNNNAPTPTIASDEAVPSQAPSTDPDSDEVDAAEQSATDAITPTVTVVPTEQPNIDETNQKPIILGFAGDVNLDEASYPVAKYDAEKKGILGVLSSDLIEEMNNADIMMLNNEFAYSTRGIKTPDKSYTFRANSSRVGILSEMGVDIVSLANNHTLDYGPDALTDTFDTLDNAGIDYVGAGENMDRAKAPIYRTLGNKKIAYVAASRVVFSMDWYANDTRLGMVGTYDPTLILESIKEAEANSDFVIVFVHWGVERNDHPEKYQRTLAKQYIDAGADAVIGCHPHVMQGIEFYEGKPIAYSLGNFWFNNSSKESGMFKLYLDPEGTVRTQILPVMNKNTLTYLLTKDAEKTDYFNFIEELSYGVKIDENGFITEEK
jgi:poly-gamma-glutamate synthesis protein (capsule biosynthesis protein)